MPFIRLKSSLDPRQLQDRINYHPEILELQLTEQDLNHPKKLRSTIDQLRQSGVNVYLHHPITYKNKNLDIMSTNPEITDYYQWSCAFLSELCRQKQVRCVVHAHYSRTESSTACGRSASMKMKDRIERIIESNKDCFLWENTTRGLFSFMNPYFLSEIIQPLQLPLCFDVSHAFISVKGNNQKLLQIIAHIHAYIHYYHIVDSAGTRHDALPLGKGKIDWKSLKPLLMHNDFIFEISLKNPYDCKPMIESADYWNKLPASP